MARFPRRISRCFSFLPFFLSVVSILFFYTGRAAAGESLCAEVKLEIKQELTLERQAFDAHMRINNGLAHITLEDVDIDVSFEDEDGNPVTASFDPNADPETTGAKFWISVDTMTNISDVNGNGSVDPSTSADIHWLIIPVPGAASDNPSGTLYYVGATLTYTIGGEENVTNVTPDYIYVKPMPELALDYFMPEAVYGDDAFTPETEPAIPFSLGLRIRNIGAGPAHQLKIESAQPKIIENKQGLLVGFAIQDTEVNGVSADNSLLADFGTIEPDGAGIARWVMTCSLSGTFSSFTAAISHSDELGGELTSLIKQENTHAYTLIRDVLVDEPGRDGIRDFLVKDGATIKLFESSHPDQTVADQSGGASLAFSSAAGTERTYTLSTTGASGPVYMKIAAGFLNDDAILKSVTRSDGKTIKADNAWISKTRHLNPAPGWDSFFNLFDMDPTGAYTVVFDDASTLPQPPVLALIPDRTGAEDQSLGFLVQASDPNGDTPLLSVDPIPVGAVFTDHHDGTAFFEWTPEQGQYGVYPLRFTASDGVLQTEQPMMLTIHPYDDTDGDGMTDAWETEHFGSLDRDGTGDFDGDGILDLDEFLMDLDPETGDYAPGVPRILFPEQNGSVTTLRPELLIENSATAGSAATSYDVEIYTDAAMTSLVEQAGVIETTDTTAWTPAGDLLDNTRYYARVRAKNPAGASLWAYRTFFVNTANNPPGFFYFSRPVDGDDVDSLTPTISVTNATDPDGDSVTYTFEVFTDAAMTTLVTASEAVAQNAGGETLWKVTPALTDNATYYVRVTAADSSGATAMTDVSAFHINTTNQAPAAPEISAPVSGAVMASTDVTLAVANSLDADGDALTYRFEIDRVTTFDSPDKQTDNAVTEGVDITTWTVSGLSEDTRYYWRASAHDGLSQSPWCMGSFVVSTTNQSPGTPTVHNPGDTAWVRQLRPVLSVNPVGDPEFDAITYVFEVYADAEKSTLVASGESEGRKWQLPEDLDDHTTYYFQGTAKDAFGDESDPTPLSAFFVHTTGVNTAPVVVIKTPAQNDITTAETYAVNFYADDPDSDATVSLYYDTDNTGADGVLITDGLTEGDDVYMWDITAVSGTYYVYGVITDEDTTRLSYSAGTVTVDRETATVYEDAEDGATDGWEILDDDPAGASITNLYDEDRQSRVIALDGAGDANAYRLLRGDGSPWENPDQQIIQWSIRASEAYSVTIAVETSAGQRFLHYSNSAESDLGEGEDVWFGWGADSIDGSWQRFTRNLAVDLAMAQPDTTILSVNSFIFRGSGRVDDIKLMDSFPADLDTDGDGVLDADEVYLYHSLPNKADSDGDGLEDGEEIAFWADDWNVDLDGDGLVNLLDPDADADGMTDGAEVAQGRDPAVADAVVVTITVTTAEGPAQGVKVYVFSADGAYLSMYDTTDENGIVMFDLDHGATYKFRADIMGSQYWSDTTQIHGGETNLLSVHAGGGRLSITVREDLLTPIENVKVYLFSATGSYLSKNQVTAADGGAQFYVSAGTYKVRADYLGYQFWSNPTEVQADTAADVIIAHQDVTVAVDSLFQSEENPMADVPVYLFTGAGAYMNQNAATDAAGRVVFHLPEREYKVRADYLGGQFWSEILQATDITVPIVMADADVWVGWNDFSLPGVPVYVFTAQGAYLNRNGETDADGAIRFRLPAAGSYKFRTDYQSSQYWSSDTVLAPDEVNPVDISTGGGRFIFTVMQTATEPLVGVNGYVFSESGTYFGMFGPSSSDGEISFDLADGSYNIRVDYLGYQFWSPVYEVPAALEGGLLIDHQDVTATVTGVYQGKSEPIAGVPVYLFSATGSYLNQSLTTGANGEVVFPLPEKAYKLRADYLGQQHWSDDIVQTDTDIAIPMADADITVTSAGSGLDGVPVYVFSATGSYLNINAVTDMNGQISFRLPAGVYKFRADYQNSQFWSGEETLVDSETHVIEISTGGGPFVLTVLKDTETPLSGASCYVFNEAGAYLGLTAVTSSEGQVAFDLAGGAYKIRIDHLGYQLWSPVYTVPDTLSETITLLHQDVVVTVSEMFQGVDEPLTGVPVYLYTAAGAYMNQVIETDENGQSVFNLPGEDYKFRVDYLNREFWSDTINHQDTDVYVPMAEAAVVVTGGGAPLEGVPVYVFTGAGTYLNLTGATDATGSAVFRMPAAGDYTFRANYQGGTYWSDVTVLNADQTNPVPISTGGGAFSLTVMKNAVDSMTGVRCYVFNAAHSYLGMSGTTDADGRTTFNLADGDYTFRVDYLGYQFWTPVYTIPDVSADTFVIDHQDIAVTIEGLYQTSVPKSGVKVYLFKASGSYMSQYQVSDTDGMVSFSLPDQAYKVRADYLGNQFWSDVFQWEEPTVTIAEGLVRIHATRAGLDLENARVYLFTATGSYLSKYEYTDAQGVAEFIVPDRSFKFRVDEGGDQVWSEVIEVTAGVETPVDVDLN